MKRLLALTMLGFALAACGGILEDAKDSKGSDKECDPTKPEDCKTTECKPGDCCHPIPTNDNDHSNQGDMDESENAPKSVDASTGGDDDADETLPFNLVDAVVEEPEQKAE